MYRRRCSATIFRTALFTLLALLLINAPAHAQNITVTGEAETGTGTTNSMFITSDQGFDIVANLTFSENYLGLRECFQTGNFCTPGQTESLAATTGGETMNPSYNGVTYEADCANCLVGFDFHFSGSFVMPPFAPTAIVTARFGFSGSFNDGNGTMLTLSGAGTATIAMHEFTPPQGSPTWVVDSVTEWFDSPLPQPWGSADIGTTGLYGSTAYNASNDTWDVAGAGADIWGSADAFRYVIPYPPNGNEVVARVDSEDNTGPFAKAGIMFRSALTTGSRDVLLDVVPSGGIEFMARTQDGGATMFLATTQVTFPVWLKLSTDQGITASVSEDGTSWQTVGVTASPFSSTPFAGLVVTSHDTQVLNHAVFSQVSATKSTGGLQPWTDTDIGNVGQAGSASYDSSSNSFAVSGAGSDIWATTDSFNYLFQPLAGDATISTQVLGEQNTSAFAKAGLMVRSTTDPSAATVILDVVPSGAVEFMARTSAGASMVFVAGSAASAFPRSLALSREGGTVTGYADGVSLGSILVSDFASGGVLVGMAVTSHDTNVTNTGSFVVPTITANILPDGWHAQDVGATGLKGSSSFDSTTNTFTIKGAGADIWGTVDAFQYAYVPVTGEGNTADFTVQVVSEDASNPFAKAGQMYRGGLAPDAAFAILDMVPDGHVEFMARLSDGAPVQVVGSAYVGFNSLLNLYVYQPPSAPGPTAVASYSTDGGKTWTFLNASAQLTLSAAPVVGLISCSHDPNALNTAQMMLSPIRPPH